MASDTGIPAPSTRRITTRIVDGEHLRVELMDFEPIQEPWSTYRLTGSGNLVKVRIIVKDIGQILDQSGDPLLNETGEPSIQVASTTVVGIEVLERSK